MGKYAFFGGCFNPPTVAHKTCANVIAEEMKLDKVFFVPVGNGYPKEGLINENHRYKMLKLICRDSDKLDVYDIELNKRTNYKAIDVFKIIKNNFKEDDIYFVMGADNFKKILSWKDSNELIQEYKYILLDRNDIDLKSEILSNPKLKENMQNFYISNSFKRMDISSSSIRKMIRSRSNESIKDVIDNSVLEYIEENSLYL